MYYVILPAIVGTTVILAALSTLPSKTALEGEQAQGQLTQYQTFMFTAKAYFDSHAAPLITTAYAWSTLRASAPVAMANAGVPAHWKAVRRPDGYWVACTQLSEASLNRLPKLYPPQISASGALIVPSAIPTSSITSVVGYGCRGPAARPMSFSLSKMLRRRRQPTFAQEPESCVPSSTRDPPPRAVSP